MEFIGWRSPINQIDEQKKEKKFPKKINLTN